VHNKCKAWYSNGQISESRLSTIKTLTKYITPKPKASSQGGSQSEATSQILWGHQRVSNCGDIITTALNKLMVQNKESLRFELKNH